MNEFQKVLLKKLGIILLFPLHYAIWYYFTIDTIATTTGDFPIAKEFFNLYTFFCVNFRALAIEGAIVLILIIAGWIILSIISWFYSWLIEPLRDSFKESYIHNNKYIIKIKALWQK